MIISKKEKWNAVISCDENYDGVFFYGVKTTGIFCKPSCKSKNPLKNNVEFFDDVNEAVEKGFRPCKRCRPDLPDYKPMIELVERVKNIFDSYFDDNDRINFEIKSLGISHNYLINLFHKRFNITPADYIHQLRLRKATQLLNETDMNILNIAFECGFKSLSAFYNCFKRYTNSTPGRYRDNMASL